MGKIKLTLENLNKLKPGDVVKLSGHEPAVAVVSAIEGMNIDSKPGLVVIRFRCPNGYYFGFGGKSIDGSISFEILTEHEPVANYGLDGWDFVCNRCDQ